MKKLLFILALLATKAWAQPVRFESNYQADRPINLNRAVPAADGGLTAAGTYASSLDLNASYLTRRDVTGREVWTNMMIGTSDIDLKAVAATPDGGCIATGAISVSGRPAAVICRIDANGNTIWIKSLPAGRSGNAVLFHNGGYMFAGLLQNSIVYGSCLIRTDTNGRVIWGRFYNSAGGLSKMSSLIPTNDKGFIMVGSVPSGSRYYVSALKVDSLGKAANLSLGVSFEDYSTEAMSVVQAADGGMAIAGSVGDVSRRTSHVMLTRVNAVGRLVWAKELALSDGDIASALTACRDGGFLLAGATGRNRVGQSDGFLIRTDDTGRILWTRLIGAAGEDALVSVHELSDNGFMLAGTSSSFGAAAQPAAYFLRTDAAGRTGCNTRDSLATVKTC